MPAQQLKKDVESVEAHVIVRLSSVYLFESRKVFCLLARFGIQSCTKQPERLLRMAGKKRMILAAACFFFGLLGARDSFKVSSNAEAFIDKLE